MNDVDMPDADDLLDIVNHAPRGPKNDIISIVQFLIRKSRTPAKDAIVRASPCHFKRERVPHFNLTFFEVFLPVLDEL